MKERKKSVGRRPDLGGGRSDRGARLHRKIMVEVAKPACWRRSEWSLKILVEDPVVVSRGGA